MNRQDKIQFIRGNAEHRLLQSWEDGERAPLGRWNDARLNEAVDFILGKVDCNLVYSPKSEVSVIVALVIGIFAAITFFVVKRII